MKLLENDRIKLRALEPSDLSILYKWENDTEQWEVGNALSPYSKYTLNNYIEESGYDIYQSKQQRLVIEDKATSQAVGAIDMYAFDPHNSHAAIGIIIDPSAREKKYATEALELLSSYALGFLHLNQLYVYVPMSNEKSVALFEKNGFIITGKLLQWIHTRNGKQDVYLMQKLSSY